MQFGWLSSHWQLHVCVYTFWCFTTVSNFKAIGQLVMEILHLKYLGDTESVVTNAVALVLGGCQIPMATYLRGYHKVVLQRIGNWQCYATLKSSHVPRIYVCRGD